MSIQPSTLILKLTLNQKGIQLGKYHTYLHVQACCEQRHNSLFGVGSLFVTVCRGNQIEFIECRHDAVANFSEVGTDHFEYRVELLRQGHALVFKIIILLR